MAVNYEFHLSKNLKEAFAIEGDAHDWIMSLWNLIQVFDDMADGDHPDRDKLDVAIHDAIVEMPRNGFFLSNRHTLLPLLSIAILKWKASDIVERAGDACAMSYAWRAGFYDIVLAVVQIVHGTQAAMEVCHNVLKLYGESIDDYMREMRHA